MGPKLLSPSLRYASRLALDKVLYCARRAGFIPSDHHPFGLVFYLVQSLTAIRGGL